jgi:DNA-binding response OmpR family regulator
MTAAVMLSKPVALVVEDNNDEQEMYATFFARAGFHPLTARSAAEGFALATAKRPNVVVVDVRLNGSLDGVALATTLRLDARTTSIPIIALSGGLAAKDRARLATACDALLMKPCSPIVLVQHASALIATR